MDGVMYALSAIDGSPQFAFETGAGIYSTPLVHEDVVFVSSLDKSLYAVDLNTGKKVWSFETSGRIFRRRK
jgi:outer membrane protein assembly factor BamB